MTNATAFRPFFTKTPATSPQTVPKVSWYGSANLGGSGRGFSGSYLLISRSGRAAGADCGDDFGDAAAAVRSVNNTSEKG